MIVRTNVFHTRYNARNTMFRLLAGILILGQAGWGLDPVLHSLTDLRLSPDGSVLLFTDSWPDVAANRKVSRLLRVAVAGGDCSPVAGTPAGASDVTWSPDGKRIAFLAGGAVWTQVPDSAPVRVCAYARPNSYLARSGSALAWSPDGSRLVFAGTMEAAPPADPDPRVVTRILYKTKTSFSDNRRMHLFVVSSSGGAPRQLTSGNFDEHSPDWGSGGEIVFLSNREPDPDANFNYDVHAVHPESGQVRRITKTRGVEILPRVSPDGRLVTFLATRRAVTTIDSVAEDMHVMVAPMAGGEARDITGKLDRRCQAPRWAPDSRLVYFLAADRGKVMLFRSAPEGGEPETVVGRPGEITDYSVARLSGSLAFTFTDSLNPMEVHTPERQLTRLNVAPAPLSRPRELDYVSPDGTRIQGWLYPALGVSGPAPMVLSIHGGPHGLFTFGYNAAAQDLARSGYAVLTLNPRGSAGYGQKFSDGTLNDWGGGDFRDLMAGVDHVLTTEKGIDRGRLAVMGASYGGYMTNWVITHTNRFRAAISIASLSNLVSFYGTSLYQDLIHAEYGGRPWEGNRFQVLWLASPLAWVSQAVTPTLFLHGEADHDVPITQGEEMYTALRQKGVEASMVRYPREGHGLSEPRHVDDMRRRTMEWLSRHLR